MTYKPRYKRELSFRPEDPNRDIDGIWKHDMFEKTEMEFQNEKSNCDNQILFISNLSYSVTEKDLNDLFGSIGRVKNVCLHHDKSGSLRTAKVTFERKVDALEAIEQFNGRFLDHNKIKIELSRAITKEMPQRSRRGEIQQHDNCGRIRTSAQQRIESLTARFNEINLK